MMSTEKTSKANNLNNSNKNVIDEATRLFNETAFDIGKLLISLSTGIIMLSVTFQGRYLNEKPDHEIILFLGWILELISIIVGTLFLFCMLRVWDIRDKIKNFYWPALLSGILQYFTFLLGLIALVVFTGMNIK